jgi:hypothetical protein
VVAGCDRRLGDSDFRGKLLASLGKNRGACASAQEWMRRNSPLRRCVASHINCCFSNTLHKFLKVLSHDLPQRCGDHRGEPSPALRGIAGIAIAARLVLRDFSKARVYVVIIARQREAAYSSVAMTPASVGVLSHARSASSSARLSSCRNASGRFVCGRQDS